MAISGMINQTSTYETNRVYSSSSSKTSGLSEPAKQYLTELQQKYADINITVTDFASDKQLKSYMLGCSGYNNIAISSSIIEKMANDPATAAKYEKVIAEVPESAEKVKKGCEAQGCELMAFSVVVDKNGKVGYCGVGKGETVENLGTVYKEKVQKQLEEKRAKRKEEEALKEKKLEKAETLEKLLEKIKNGVSENEVAEGEKIKETGKGEQIDLSV